MSPDLSTSYLSLPLRTPLVASSSPLTGDLDALRALEAAGVSAVVLSSLFEEQLTLEALQVHALLETSADSHPEASGYFPLLDSYNTGPAGYLRHLEAAKAALSVPVIASLNGSSPGGWLRYARMLQDSGADAIELNVYGIAADPHGSGRLVEEEVVETVGLDRWCERPRAVQPLLPARHRPGVAIRDPASRAVHARGAAPTVALDRDPPRAGAQAVPGRDDRDPQRPGRRQGRARRGRRDHARLGVAAKRP